MKLKKNRNLCQLLFLVEETCIQYNYREVLFSQVHTLKPLSILYSKVQALLQLVIALVGRKIYPVKTEMRIRNQQAIMINVSSLRECYTYIQRYVSQGAGHHLSSVSSDHFPQPPPPPPKKKSHKTKGTLSTSLYHLTKDLDRFCPY